MKKELTEEQARRKLRFIFISYGVACLLSALVFIVYVIIEIVRWCCG
jgi:hypothetical protein